MFYSEILQNKTSAIKREKFLKSGQGRKFLDSLEIKSTLSSVGRASS